MKEKKLFYIEWIQTRIGRSKVMAQTKEEASRLAYQGKDGGFEPFDYCGGEPDWDIVDVLSQEEVED